MLHRISIMNKRITTIWYVVIKLKRLISKCSKCKMCIRLCKEGDQQGIVQDTEISSYDHMVYAQIRICLMNEMQKILRNFKVQTDPLIWAKR